MENISNTNARLATLDRLIETTIRVFLDPPPSKDTLRNWFDEARIPRFKSNPSAKKGGGTVFYSVPHIEKFFRNRMTIAPAGELLKA